MNRATGVSIATMGLLLTACACHRVATDVPSQATKGVPSRTTHSNARVQFDGTAGRQVASLRWNRPGDWTPIRLVTKDPSLGMALVARDQYGDRILSVHGKTGYDVNLVDVDCAHHGIVYKETRTSPRDDIAIDPARRERRGRPLPTSPAEVMRLCAKPPAVVKGSPTVALARLRDAGDRAAAKVQTPPPPLDAATRERMWHDYQARSAAAGK